MLYTATTNSISTMGFNFEVFVYLEGLVKSSNNHKSLQQKTINANRKLFRVSILLFYIKSASL